MNSVVTITTKTYRLAHLLTSEVFLEPFIAMATPGNQVMLSRS